MQWLGVCLCYVCARSGLRKCLLTPGLHVLKNLGPALLFCDRAWGQCCRDLREDADNCGVLDRQGDIPS